MQQERTYTEYRRGDEVRVRIGGRAYAATVVEAGPRYIDVELADGGREDIPRENIELVWRAQ